MTSYGAADSQRYDIALSAAPGARQLHWKQVTRGYSWKRLVAGLTNTDKMKPDKAAAHGMLAGLLLDNGSTECPVEGCTDLHKTKLSVAHRSLVTLDCDEVDDEFVDRVKAQGWAGLLFTSHSHGLPGKGNRYRLILRPSRQISNDEYEAVCLWVIHKIGGGWKDYSTTQFWRTMYLPSTPDPETFQSWVMEGSLVDVDTAFLLAPPAPTQAARQAQGPGYDGPDYEDLEPWQKEQADERVQQSLNRLWADAGAYLSGDADQDKYEGWDKRLSDVAWALACIAMQPWNDYGEDDARTTYESMVPWDSLDEGADEEERFRSKIERALDKAVEAPVSLPPWAVSVSVDEAFSDDLPEEGPEAPEASSGSTAGAGASGPAAPRYRLLQGPDEGWRTSPNSVPLKVAKDVKKFYSGRLRWWRGDWWAYDGAAAWSVYEPARLSRELMLLLDKAFYRKMVDGEWEDVPWNPTPANVAAVREFLGLLVLLGEERDQPCWLDGVSRGAGPWVACQDGVVRISDRSVHENKGKFFNSFSVPFNYDGDAPEPVRWLAFLEQVLPDEDQRLLLQQWFGYVLSGRTDLEKALLIVGPRRAGKGTIAHVLSALVGMGSVAAPNMTGLSGNFGMQSLIKARLAIMGDVRLGDRANHGALQVLLGIIGRDVQTVARKNKTDWVGYLNTLFMIMSNEVPHFDDPSGAIVSRFEILQLRQSFYGREDFGLKDRLLGELPGIFRWALDGLDSLGTDGRLVSPESSVETEREFHEAASPISVWADEECSLREGAWASTGDLFDSYRAWCTDRGDKPPVRVHFARSLRAALPGIRPYRAAGVRGYSGIDVRSVSDKLFAEPGIEPTNGAGNSTE